MDLGAWSGNLTAVWLRRATAEITAGIDQSGQPISMQTGQLLAVSLPSNPSTGYRWEVETIDSRCWNR